MIYEIRIKGREVRSEPARHNFMLEQIPVVVRHLSWFNLEQRIGI